jgi:hypothetical protein
MADESMQMPPDEGSDTIGLDSEIPVRIDSLEADGVRPSVGDTVTLRVEGTVKSIENDCVYVTPEKVNDDDLAQLLAENADDEGNEDSLMRRITSQADQMGTPMGGGGY